MLPPHPYQAFGFYHWITFPTLDAYSNHQARGRTQVRWTGATFPLPAAVPAEWGRTVRSQEKGHITYPIDGDDRLLGAANPRSKEACFGRHRGGN